MSTASKHETAETEEKPFSVNERSRQDGQNYINNIDTILIKNAENLDKLIITLSSGFLAISISFIHNIVPLSTAHFLWVLLASWSSFILSIIVNVVSYFIAYHECNLRKKLARDFYFKGIGRAGEDLQKETSTTQMLNYCSTIFYITGTICITLFVFLNIHFSGGKAMAAQKIPAPSVSAPQKIEDTQNVTRSRNTTDGNIEQGTATTSEPVSDGDGNEDNNSYTRGRTTAIPPVPPIDKTIVNKTNTNKK